MNTLSVKIVIYLLFVLGLGMMGNTLVKVLTMLNVMVVGKAYYDETQRKDPSLSGFALIGGFAISGILTLITIPVVLYSITNSSKEET